MNHFLHKLSGLPAVIWATLASFFYSLLFGPKVIRARTCDVAFTYRMGAGFPGDVNRMHPASILPGLINATNPPRAYGEPCLFDTTNGYRAVIATDQHDSNAITLGGIIVRPFPTQQQSGGMSASIGGATPPVTGVADFLRTGYIMVKAKAGVTIKKGDPCYVWAVATETVNIQGEWQVAATSSKTCIIANARFNGPADANGNVEVEIRAA